MDSPDAAVRNGVARDVVFLEAVGINPVVVHGGGKAITRAMEKAGLQANFIQGQRVTDEPDGGGGGPCVVARDQSGDREDHQRTGRQGAWVFRRGHFQVPQALARRQGKAGRKN